MRAYETGWNNALSLIFRPRVYQLLYNTLRLGFLVTLLSVLLGVFLAWCLERTDLPGRRIWNVLVTLPFAVPSFVSGYSWISLTPAVEGFYGAVLIMTLTNYPLVYLPAMAALRTMNPALEESSRSLGHSKTATFFKVTLPNLKPALLGGGVLVMLHMFMEFGTLAFLNYDTFTTAIYDQYLVAFNGTTAAMYAMVLLVLCFSVLLIEVLAKGSKNYASIRRGGLGKHPAVKLRYSKYFIIPGLVTLLIFAIGVPAGALIYWFAAGSSAGINLPEILQALYATVAFGAGGGVLALFFAIPLVILVVRYRGMFSVLAEKLPYFIYGFPGIVVGLAFVFFAIRFLHPLYQTAALLILGYAVLYLPLAQTSIQGVLVQIPAALNEISASLGSNAFKTFFRVTLPLISPGVGVGFALVCLKIMKELTATLILRPTGVETLATMIWEHTENARYAASAPYAILLILVSGLPVYLLTMRSFTERNRDRLLQ